MGSLVEENIRSYTKAECVRLGLGEGAGAEAEAFELVAAEQVLTQHDPDDDEIERGHIGGYRDGGYDGIYIYVNGMLANGEDPDAPGLTKGGLVEVHLIQAKYKPQMGEDIFQKWKDSFTNLMEEGRDLSGYDAEVVDAFSLMRAILSRSLLAGIRVSITFWAVTLTGQINDAVRRQASELKALTEKIVPLKNTDISVELVDAARLCGMIETDPDTMCELTGVGGPLVPDQKSALLVVPLRDYVRFITEDGKLNRRMFEANIRDYQQKTVINKRIAKTLRDGGDVDFWWFNNGITIIADEVSRNMGNKVTLRNPRIVNGLQTSYEIYNYAVECGGMLARDDRNVLVRCMATEDENVRAQLILSTNGSTPIPPVYMRSLDPVQLQIQRYFKNNDQCLRYDRRKGECRAAKVPARGIVSMQFLGQCLTATILGSPDRAYAHPSKIMADDRDYRRIFNGETAPEAYLNIARLRIFIKRNMCKVGLSGQYRALLYHILYVMCARAAGHLDIKAKDLAALKAPTREELANPVDGATLAELERAARFVQDKYVKAGDANRVAKSRDFTDSIKRDLRNLDGLA